MALFHFLLTTFLSIITLATSHPSQQPIFITCDSVSTYTTEWFLSHTLPIYRQEIHSKALFYTKGTSQQARKLACESRKREFVTIWDVWPKYLYDDNDVVSNKLRCIHNTRSLAMEFYENMSRAYARLARKSATIMHSTSDYSNPPMDGIWGRIELPTLSSATDIVEMEKINEDRTTTSIFQIPQKASRRILEKAIEEVRMLLREARDGWTGGKAEDENGGSCAFWDRRKMDFLDGLF